MEMREVIEKLYKMSFEKMYYCKKYGAICSTGKCSDEPIKIESIILESDVKNITNRNESYIKNVKCGSYIVLKLEDNTKIYFDDYKYINIGNCIEIQRQYSSENEDIFESIIMQKTKKFLKETWLEIPLSKIPRWKCRCEKCKKFCEDHICFSTPNDIINLIDRGYANRLMIVYGGLENDIEELAPANVGYEQKVVSYPPKGACTFYKNGKCEINIIKPTMGRLFTHQYDAESRYKINGRISDLWDSEIGENIINLWRRIIKSQMLEDD